MTTLTKDQQACVAFPEERNLIVRGVAGSGKSLVLLNRALNLSRKAKANGGALSIGLFTFANTLVNYTDEVLDVEGEASTPTSPSRPSIRLSMLSIRTLRLGVLNIRTKAIKRINTARA